MSWFKLFDNSLSFKTHFIDEFLVSQLAKDLSERNEDFEQSPQLSGFLEEVRFEINGGRGMYAMNQPRESFQLGNNKTLTIDSAKADLWMESLKKAKIRKFSNNADYIKLYSYMACLILMPSERESLLFQISGRLDKMHSEAEKFNDSLDKALRGTNILRLDDIEDLLFPDPEDDPFAS